MPYFGLHYGGTYSVNPLGIRRDSEAPSRGRMDRKTTSAAGLASSRGTRLFREAAFGAAALAMALGLAAWVTDFDLAAWINPASANVGSTSSFDERFGPGSVRRSLAINYPWRPAAADVRISMRSSGTSKASWADNRARSRTFSPRRPRRRSRRRSRCREPGRSWPIFSQRGAIRRRFRRTTAPCSRSSPIWCRCASRWRR